MNTAHLKKQILLKKKEDRRIRSGHLWVFSNEIQEVKGDPVIGDVVELLSAGGLSLGVGLYNPHSLIAFRLLSSSVEEIDQHFFRRRIARALDVRQKLSLDGDAMRVIHGEADSLPGLIVDKYNDYLAIQTLSFGMDLRLPLICDVLEEMFRPTGIVARNESSLRTLEQLPPLKTVLRGRVAPTTILEHGVRYVVDLMEGQKTGFYLDQKENRAVVRRYSKDAKVLDCFCNDGGFALNAAYGGAASVEGIDSSPEAILRAQENARLNNLMNVTFLQGDVFEKLKQLIVERQTYDVIVLDPPSFTRSRKNVQTAKKGYRSLHTHAFTLLKKNGILLTASCSHHIEGNVFVDIVDDAARKLGRQVQLLDWRGASPDHPVLPAVPETRYLKFGVFHVD